MAKAICALRGDGVKGEIMFEQKDMDAPTVITGEIRGLTEGVHGLAICSYGDITRGGETCGPHFNPHEKTHGGPADERRHAGDLGNVDANEDGVATVTLTDKQVKLIGPLSVFARSVVVTMKEDDLGKGGHELSLTTGNAGDVVACGVIGIASL